MSTFANHWKSKKRGKIKKFTKCELSKIKCIFGMKVHLIRKETIVEFAKQNAQSRVSFTEWLTKIKYANWGKPADMQITFPSTDLLGKGSSRAVFDIGGNKYRMIGKYAFGDKQVHLFVCWIGTHAEYDKLCDENEQYTVSNY
jgi:mRNA interferase HigB